ncbi:class I SAM-dependent rRNA methyltransferase [Silvibacterium acidisoli]|uniref:class I SAM-dependent rRNA methyltransferase n=1 Tax=Acidobacteriaceae bacterium ZG23-2 TaxID=2883246 RepID=UPI00406C4CDB
MSPYEKKQTGKKQAAPRRKPSGTPRPQAIPSIQIEGPAAVISRRAADRLRAGHVWVYKSDVLQISEPQGLLPVVDQRGILLGTALYSPASEISLRMVSTEALESDRQWLDLLRERLRAAIRERKEIFSAKDTDSCRLVFSEADGLPGIIIDKYGDLVLLQLLSRALDNHAVRLLVVDIIRQELDPETIVERPDARIRELEELDVPLDGAPLYAKNAADPLLTTTFHLNGLKLHYDASAGQKTGAFLDQRENYAAAARYAFGEALDVCTYQGGFALHMAKSCSRVTGVDVSRAALEIAERNLEANREAFGVAEVDWVEANAFDLLRDWSEAGREFDTIVLDPPAFAKSKRAVEGALRGYKEMNLRAMKMLRPGGILVTCSCSHHVSLADFSDVVAAAAGDAGRRVRLLERRGAAADHPVVITIPETEYLKCLILKVD